MMACMKYKADDVYCRLYYCLVEAIHELMIIVEINKQSTSTATHDNYIGVNMLCCFSLNVALHYTN